MKNYEKDVDEGIQPDTKKLDDAICQLKAYVRIMEVFIEYHWENEALNDIGIIVDKISDIVEGLEKEYLE